MKKRDLFEDLDLSKIQQGTIFRGAIANNYNNNCEVYGVIITPRCDIANGKVNTYHYLPVVSLSDWKYKDFWTIFSHQIYSTLIGNYKQTLIRFNVSPNLIGKFSFESIQEKLLLKITKEKEKEKLNNIIDDLKKLHEWKLKFPPKDTINYFLTKYEKLSKNIFRELKGNKMKGFYLLEDWNDNSSYFIILLREIKRISVEVGDKLGKGIYAGYIPDGERQLNDLQKYEDKYEMYYGIKRIKSPYIEHLIQMFFQNFGRIGVSDHNNNLENDLFKLINL